jgi:hypothetical protein
LKKPRRFYFRLRKNVSIQKNFLVQPLKKLPGCEKTKKVLFQTSEKIRAFKKPSWFNVGENKKTSKG